MADFIVRRLDRIAVNVGVWENGGIVGIEEDDDAVAYVALEGNQIIGALTINRKARKSTKTVSSRCTGVRAFRQQHGVAQALWSAMIKTEKPSIIRVTTVSNRGRALIRSMRKKFRKIKWEQSGG